MTPTMLRHVLFVAVSIILFGCASGDGALTADEESDLAALRPFDHCDHGGPCPDLRLNVDVLKQSIVIETRDVDARSCSVNEGTIHDGGRRRLLRFTTSTTNVGTGDLFLGDPTHGNPKYFEFATCHGHFHFRGYADYTLNALDGSEAAKGHKESFCVEDNIQGSGRNLIPRPAERLADSGAPLSSWNPRQRTNCHNPGLHRGWTDAYFNTTEGNWIDVTDVPPGDYMLVVAINPAQMIAELRYDNNRAEIPVHIPDSQADGNVCPPYSDAIFRCSADATQRSKCFRGVTTTETCPATTTCKQVEETAHPGRCL